MKKELEKNRITTALAALLLSGSAFALTPPPPLPEAELVAFYQAMDGDNWVRNDGWLDDDTPICDWHGISCRNNPEWGYIGQFQGQQLVIENLAQPRDLDNGMPDDTSGITPLLWGELTIDFHDTLSAELQYDSEKEDYGSGQYPLTRLAQARLAECEG